MAISPRKNNLLEYYNYLVKACYLFYLAMYNTKCKEPEQLSKNRLTLS